MLKVKGRTLTDSRIGKRSERSFAALEKLCSNILPRLKMLTGSDKKYTLE